MHYVKQGYFMFDLMLPHIKIFSGIQRKTKVFFWRILEDTFYGARVDLPSQRTGTNLNQ